MWSTEMIAILRVLINDTEAPQTYSNARLTTALVIAALYVYIEVSFDTTYSISITSETISPDPAATSTRDDNFITLVCLKAACIILGGEAKKAALESFTVTDGPSTISTGGRYVASKDAANSICEKYVEAKNEYEYIRANGASCAILTPYTNPSIYPDTTFQ